MSAFNRRLLFINEKPVSKVATLAPGVDLEHRNIWRRLGPVPLQVHTAGGRKHGGPLLQIVSARWPHQAVPLRVDYDTRYHDIEQHDDHGEEATEAAS